MPQRILKHVEARTGFRQTFTDTWASLHDPAGRRILKTSLSVSLIAFGVPCLLNRTMFQQSPSFAAFAAVAPEGVWGSVAVLAGVALFFTRAFLWGFLAQFVALLLFGLILSTFLAHGLAHLTTAAGIYTWMLIKSAVAVYLKAEFRAETIEADRLREAKRREST